MKDFFIIKDSAPAIGWATCVVLYPSINATSNPNLFELIMCYISVFTGSFILEIICDIRDYNGDNKQGIKSLPVQLGMLKTKAIINILNIFSAIVILLLVFSGIISYPWLLFVVNNILVYILVNYMFEKLKGNRLISHILIFFQIILTIILGFIS
ncbi:MAG: UbiA family prenyltransferase [Promethearchaeota archaeon]